MASGAWLGDFLLRRAVLQLEGKLGQDNTTDAEIKAIQGVAFRDFQHAVNSIDKIAQQQVRAAAKSKKDAADGVKAKTTRKSTKAKMAERKRREALQNALDKQAVRKSFSDLQEMMKKLDASNSDLVKDAARKEVTYLSLSESKSDTVSDKQVEIARRDAKSARAHVIKLYGTVGLNILSLRNMLCDMQQLSKEADGQGLTEEELAAVQSVTAEHADALATLNVAIGLSEGDADCSANPPSRVDDGRVAARFDALCKTLAMSPEALEQVSKISYLGVCISALIKGAGKALAFFAKYLFLMFAVYSIVTAGATGGLPAALAASYYAAAKYGFAQCIRWLLATMKSNEAVRKAIMATRDAIVSGLVRMAVPEQYAKYVVDLAANPIVVAIVIQSVADALAGNLADALSNVSVGAQRVDTLCDAVNSLQQSPFRSAEEVTEFVKASGNSDLIASMAEFLGKPAGAAAAGSYEVVKSLPDAAGNALVVYTGSAEAAMAAVESTMSTGTALAVINSSAAPSTALTVFSPASVTPDMTLAVVDGSIVASKATAPDVIQLVHHISANASNMAAHVSSRLVGPMIVERLRSNVTQAAEVMTEKAYVFSGMLSDAATAANSTPLSTDMMEKAAEVSTSAFGSVSLFGAVSGFISVAANAGMVGVLAAAKRAPGMVASMR